MPTSKQVVKPKQIIAWYDCTQCGKEYGRYLEYSIIHSKYGTRFESVFRPPMGLCNDCLDKMPIGKPPAGTVSSRNLQEVQDRVETVGVGTCGQRFNSVDRPWVTKITCDRPLGHAGKHSENGVE